MISKNSKVKLSEGAPNYSGKTGMIKQIFGNADYQHQMAEVEICDLYKDILGIKFPVTTRVFLSELEAV